MNARIVLAISGCVLAGALVAGTTGRVSAQSATPLHVAHLPVASNAGAIWGDDQNVFVLVGDRLFKVRKYDMKIDGSVALRMNGMSSGAAAQRIRHSTHHPRIESDEE